MNKFDIGVVTFYDAYNYGAVLQTYALQTFLKKNKINSCIVDFDWKQPEHINSIRGFLYWLKYHKSICKKQKSFKEFLRSLSFSPKYEEKDMHNLNSVCRKFVVGSDQVWNYKWNNNKNAFYLTFAKEKYSYAASFGSSDNINPARYKQIKDDLSKFSVVSVREKSGIKFLEKMGVKAQQNIDPVFLLDKKEWEKLNKKRIISHRYLLVYSLENNKEMLDFAVNFAKSRGLEPYIIADTSKKHIHGIKVLSYSSPLEFLNFFQYSSYVITNSFHGTAFSILFEKQFVTFLQEKIGAPNERLLDLLESCDLSSRIYSKSSEFAGEIDFTSARNFICREVKSAETYFSWIIKDKCTGMKNMNSTLYYYAKSKKADDINGSRSGGVAYLLEKKTIEEGGVVYGTIIKNVSDVCFDRITNNLGLEPTRNSKYVDSELGNTFSLVEADLNAGRNVLFTGLSCQVYSLIKYLDYKKVDREKLLTIDFVCHGTVERKYFKDYFDYIGDEISHFNFRDKSYGWATHFESYFKNGKKKKSRKFADLFYSNCALKAGCYKCPFASLSKPSDITLSDAWSYIKDDDRMTGANLVQINTELGRARFNDIHDALFIETITRLDKIQDNQLRPTAKPGNYSIFKNIYETKGFKKSLHYVCKMQRKIRLKNRIKSVLVKFLRPKTKNT